MKFKKEVSFSLFIVLLTLGSVSGQVVKTAAVPYTKGASPFTPSITSSSELRVDTAASALYWWDRDALTWMRFRPGIDVVTGSSAPAYTPRDNQSLFAVNADGELYYYNSPSWVQIGGSGGGGIYGGSGSVADGTVATLADDFEFSGGDISSFTVSTGTTNGGQLFSNLSGATVIHRDTSNNYLELTNAGANFNFGGTFDRLTITGRDARYNADYSGTYSNRSIPDKEYVDGVATAAVSIPETEIAFGDVGDASITSTPELTYQTPILGILADEAEFSAINTAASSATGGGLLTLAAIDGAALASGDRLGQVRFFGQTGVGGTAVGANIDAYTEGVWGSGDAPTGLYFFTTPDGSSTALERLKITNTGAIGIKKNSAGTTEDFVSIAAYGSESDLNFAIVPKGTGALTASISDGTAAGGNARGARAVDLQTDRNAASQVASGANSFIGGGRRNTASGSYSVAIGGASTASNSGAVALGGNGSTGATASGAGSFAVGAASTASGDNSFAVQAGTASGVNSTSFGGITAALRNEFGIGSFSFVKYSQKTITGLAATELFLDNGDTERITIAASTGLQFNIVVSAVVSVPGGGTVVAGDIYCASFNGVIANKGGTTALIGTVDADMAAKADANMADVVFTISADNANDALKIEYTAGAGSTGSTQTIVKVSIRMFRF